jgi:2-polyprenyl-3-methyl-5-hydroxy-6-metoxy-1,4-benzoquinol methylase
MHENTRYRLDCLAQVSLKYLTAAAVLRATRAVSRRRRDRFVWSITDVGNSVFPDADLRNYYEARNIRGILSRELAGRSLQRACELGCGYGRITPVLSEFASETIGLEREPQLVRLANHYLRHIVVRQVAALTDVASHGPFDLVLICTVLQHCTSEYAAEVLERAKAAIRPAGYLLLIESTDEDQVVGDPAQGQQFLSQPRPMDFYVHRLKPFELVDQRPRELEKSFIGKPGSLMLFKAPS